MAMSTRVLELIANSLGTDVVDLRTINFTDELLELIPPSAAKRYQCVPLGVDEENVIHLCVVDPLNKNNLDNIARELGCAIQVRVADPELVRGFIVAKYYKKNPYTAVPPKLEPSPKKEEWTRWKCIWVITLFLNIALGILCIVGHYNYESEPRQGNDMDRWACFWISTVVLWIFALFSNGSRTFERRWIIK